jgi:hypothetical protein
MMKFIVSASVAFVLLPSLTLGAAFPPPKSKVPLLSGTYLFMGDVFCQATQTVTTPNGSSTTAALNNMANGLQQGTMAFVQGSTPDTGTVTEKGNNEEGSPFLESGDVGAGNNTEPLNKNSEGGSGSFKQTATTISFPPGKFTITYGKVSGGIAQSAVFGGIDVSGCGRQSMLILQ